MRHDPQYGAAMKTVRVQHTFHAPIDRVFDVISDHAGYTRLPGIKAAKVVKPGTTEHNGLGAVREISLGVPWFREEVTVFERPRRMDYRITASRPVKIDHEGGSMQLETVGDTTVVTWTSTFRIQVPVIGGVLTRLAARNMRTMFARGLAKAETLAR